ncbi:MAG: glycosyltransferase family 4 protein [Acidobacteria bacterium]|nr:glycosyltransferase family 4 protein [Acidobacteriota bacterium]
MSRRIAAGTIVAKNYIAYARVWAKSFRAHHPEARVVVLLTDRNDGTIDPANEPFEVIEAEAIGIDSFLEMAFRYDVMELSTAVKPAFLERLLEDGADLAFYFDPDILVLSDIESVVEKLGNENIALTPHSLSPIPVDGRRPSEAAFLVSGAYNLGFIGVRRSAETARMLSWWKARLIAGGASAPEKGLFTDQKWIDLVPSFFDGVAIVRDPTLNLAYWNLHERGDITRVDDRFLVGGAPIRFFHFSGFVPGRPGIVSKHQDRFGLEDLSAAARELFEIYARSIAEAGHDTVRDLAYSYGRFDDGEPIVAALRAAYRAGVASGHAWSDPFRTGPGSFRDWATSSKNGHCAVPPLARVVWESRSDVRAVFPLGLTDQADGYLEWLAGPGASEAGLGSEVKAGLGRLASPVAVVATPPPAEPTSANLGTASSVPPGRPERPWDFFFHDPPLFPWERHGYSVPAGSPLTKAIERLLGEIRYRRSRFRYWCGRFQPERARFPAAGTDDGSAPNLHETSVTAATVEARITPIEAPFGVNLFGYLDTESGVAEVARCFIRMLKAEGVPVAPITVPQEWLRREDHSVASTATTTPFPVNLFFVNADQLPNVLASRRALLDGRRSVGYWFWELEEFPARFEAALGAVDEVWVASTFCQRSISSRAAVPVVCIPPTIDTSSLPRGDRARFGLRASDIVFLHIFDAASFMPRKNPEAAIAAFRRAFPEPGHEVLLLKTVNATPEQLRELQRSAGRSRVRIMNGYASREEILSLHASSDVCVSMHRSEGLGLTLLEAMGCGKPVIATAYGGCADFLRPGSAKLVPFRRVPVGLDIGPYPATAIWADPCVETAAEQMRELAADRAAATRLGQRGREVLAEWATDAGALARARIASLASRRPSIS